MSLPIVWAFGESYSILFYKILKKNKKTRKQEKRGDGDNELRKECSII